MKKVMIALGIILIGLAGCGKNGKDYVGKYIYEYKGMFDNRKEVLEIKQDHTYILKTDYKNEAMTDLTTTGKWKIDEDEIVLYHKGSGVPELIGKVEGDTLVDRFGNRTFIRQN